MVTARIARSEHFLTAAVAFTSLLFAQAPQVFGAPIEGIYLFYENFEDLGLGSTNGTDWWNISTYREGAAVVDSVHARGQNALHISATGGSKAFLQPITFSPPGNSVWGRMWIWMEAFPTAPDYAHFTLVEASGKVGDGSVIRPIGGQYIPGVSAQALWGTGSDLGPTGDWLNWRATAPTVNQQWTCLEFQLDNQMSAMKLWIDGVAKPELTVTRDNHNGTQVPFVFPTFDKIGIGFQEYQRNTTPATFNLWIDDIALTTTRIGCDCEDGSPAL
ncbi:hypothetical protein M427DRAFT_67416 [Gonapodya prolifera JEL478]|uniref:Cip1-like core domain-containing protein n=1 Tax=Gonapodya prolifera (strain JEL478) TaxID=1344416 RepID=A0A139APV6_GONPJ|nr:hypothetical protein M427DRAFT_67416 [Gonapodya prolifera JEL478]|eukprot:KXS18780.1 hypothetical protein M427DRAFT_67416 [Gonapodya prolifera JEL478]